MNITRREFIANLMNIYFEVLIKYINDPDIKILINIGMELVKTKENKQQIYDLLKENKFNFERYEIKF